MEIQLMETDRKAVSRILATVVTDETMLYIKTKNASWNISRAGFYEIPKFYETQIGQLDEMIDNLAERIWSLGHYAPATLKCVLMLRHLMEMTPEEKNSNGFTKSLLTDHQIIVRKLNKNILPFINEFHDVRSSDFISELMEKHKKMAYFLRSYLKKMNPISSRKTSTS